MVSTALDSNILSALWSQESIALKVSIALTEAKRDGDLLISPIVYAELMAHPRAMGSHMRDFLSNADIRADFHVEDAVWTDCGRRYARYAARRRRSGGSEPKRFLADFFIGSHALLQADRLMTTDVGRYRTDFPELTLYLPL